MSFLLLVAVPQWRTPLRFVQISWATINPFLPLGSVVCESFAFCFHWDLCLAVQAVRAIPCLMTVIRPTLFVCEQHLQQEWRTGRTPVTNPACRVRFYYGCHKLAYLSFYPLVGEAKSGSASQWQSMDVIKLQELPNMGGEEIGGRRGRGGRGGEEREGRERRSTVQNLPGMYKGPKSNHSTIIKSKTLYITHYKCSNTFLGQKNKKNTDVCKPIIPASSHWLSLIHSQHFYWYISSHLAGPWVILLWSFPHDTGLIACVSAPLEETETHEVNHMANSR